VELTLPDVVVIGGANLDIKAKSFEVNRFGTSNPGIVTTSPGGVGRNIAHNLARLGAKVALIAAIGDDHQGNAVLAATRGAGVDVSRVNRSAASTGTYVAVLNPNGEMVTALSDMSAVDAVTPSVIANNAEAIAAARFVVADCNLSIETLRAVAALARDKLFIEPVSVPKSKKLLSLLKDGSVFMASPNLDQVEGLTGSRDGTKGSAALHAMGLRNIVIHAGVEGAYVSDGNGLDHVAVHPASDVIDVTGAGDAAVAGLVYGLLQNLSLAEAAALGQTMAGRVIASSKSTLD
jgi:pseudouridine kinase